MEQLFKATIIGCGNVGATTAYAYLLSGVVNELTLIDVNKNLAKGLCMDLEHARSLTPNVKINYGDDYKLCKNSNVVIITAGLRQKEGETRLDLVKGNKKIFAEIVPKIVKNAPDSLLIIVTNPVDVMTYEAFKLSGLPKNRVFGSGTFLDSTRLQFHISEKINVHPGSVDAYILGEHGDSSFPVFSSANVLGKSLFKFEGFDRKVADQCYEDTRTAAYRIINDKGYTCYSIATAVRDLTKSIFHDEHKVFPLSVMLDDYYGHSDVCLSVPCVLGRKGIEQVLEVSLNEEEQVLLDKSVKTIREFL